MKTYNKNIIILSLAMLLMVIPLKWSLNDAKEIEAGKLYPSIYVEDTLYFYTGEEILLSETKAEEKTVSGVVDISVKPSAEGEINLPYPEVSYMKHEDNIVVKMDGSWILFKKEVEEPMDFHQYITDIQKKHEKYNLLSEERTEYFEFSQLAMNFLSDEEMKEIIKNQWEYTLTVNGEAIPRNGEITVKEGPISVKITEKRVSNPLMALDEYMKGAVSGDSYTGHIDFEGNVPDEEVVSDGTIVQGLTYVFGQEKPLEGLEFNITEEMMVRLGLGTTVIKVSTEK